MKNQPLILRCELGEGGVHAALHATGRVLDCERLINYIDDAVRNFRHISNDKFISRIFMDNGNRDDVNFRIINTPMIAEDSLLSWLERMTGGKEGFCLSVNGLNTWSDSLEEYFYEAFTSHWQSLVGIPLGGFDIYAFMGKYNITPFGIHKDNEDSYLFHLGPGVKQAWVWDPRFIRVDDFIKSNPFSTEITRDALYYELHPGDALFIPKNWFHVMKNDAFSITLGIAPYDVNASEFITSIVNREITSNTIFSDSFVFKGDVGNLSTSIIDNVFLHKKVIDIIDRKACELFLRHRSNRFFRYSSSNRIIRRESKYRYYGEILKSYSESEGAWALHCRGNTIYCNENPVWIEDFVRESKMHGLNLNDITGNNVHVDFLNKMVSFGVFV
ncbi:hypothetical protein QRZ34_27680 [Klebsiella michiganensis]|jgi:hypothetical protein|uniref:hypothetical protein n=1 Tax=Klebsiella michiganensis TaxID=1134687 RepID=UPI002570E1E9|nr:hypothetical protein [Klebsiella michiganensis]MDL4454807.1 hypothetical protein [Klebsiella michiganensis]